MSYFFEIHCNFARNTFIRAGIFLSGPITLKNNVNLQVDAGGILRMLPFGSYPVTWFTNNVTNIYFVNSGDFISGSSLTNIASSFRLS